MLSLHLTLIYTEQFCVNLQKNLKSVMFFKENSGKRRQYLINDLSNLSHCLFLKHKTQNSLYEKAKFPLKSTDEHCIIVEIRIFKFI